MSRIRKSNALSMSGAMTSAAPVSDAGTWRIRSNSAGTAIEVSYNAGAYTTLAGSSAAWSALTPPTADLTLNHGNWKTRFDFTGADAEDCFVIASAVDAPGSGVLFYVATQGAATSKAPFRVDAKGAVALVTDVNGFIGIGVDAAVAARTTILHTNTGAAATGIIQGQAVLASGSTTTSLTSVAWTTSDTGSTAPLTLLVPHAITLSRSSTAADNASLVVYMNRIDATVSASTGTIYGTWIKPTVANSKTLTNWYGLYFPAANVGGGSAITNRWAIFGEIGAGNVSLGGDITQGTDTLTLYRMISGGNQTPELSLESYGGTIASPTASATSTGGHIKFKVQGTTPSLKEIARMSALMDGANAVNPAGTFIWYLRASGAGSISSYMELSTTLLTVTPAALFNAAVTVSSAGAFKTDGGTKGFGLYDNSQSNLAQYYSQFGTSLLQHELYFQKASGTQAAPGNAAATDALGTIIWQARNAGAYATIAQISVVQDGGGNLFQIGVGSNTFAVYSNSRSVFNNQVRFTTTTTQAGINVGAFAGDPSALANGDIWYNSTGNVLNARINGATVALGAGGAGANTALSNLAAVSINASLIPQTTLDLGAAATAWRDLYLYGAGTFGSHSFKLTGTPTGHRVLTLPNATATLATLAEAETLTNKTLSTGTAVSVAIAWADGVTQTFNPNGTSSGLNVGGHAVDPSAANNADVWYQSTTHLLMARINSASVALTHGLTHSGAANAVTYWSGAGAIAAVTSSVVSGADVTWGGSQTQTLTNTGTSGTLEYLDQNITISPASASTAMHRVFSQSALFGTAQTAGNLRMRYYSVDHNQIAALTSFQGTEGIFTKSASGTVTTVYGSTFTSNISAGTATQVTGHNINLNNAGGTITTGMGFYATADNSSGTFTTFTAFRAFASGTITNLYGFASSAGFLHGFGTLAPTVTMDVVGSGLFTLASGQSLTARSDVQTFAIWDTAVASSVSSDFRFIKSRGTIASRGAVASADGIGSIFWEGYYDASSKFLVASIFAQAQGAFASFDWPTDLVFQTASTSTRRTVARMTSDQRFGIGDQITHAQVTHRLTVQEELAATTGLQALTAYDTSSSGTPAATFGQSHRYQLKSSTTVSQLAAQVGVRWQDATHASRSAVYSVATVANAAVVATPQERMVLGGFKTLVDNVQTDLFTITFQAADHTAVGGWVQFIFIAKQVSGSSQTQVYTRTVPITALHSGATNTGAATWGSETLGAAVTSTGGLTTISYRINSSATMPSSGWNVATFSILIDSDLTTVSELSCYYNIILSGQCELTLA